MQTIFDLSSIWAPIIPHINNTNDIIIAINKVEIIFQNKLSVTIFKSLSITNFDLQEIQLMLQSIQKIQEA